MEASPSLVLFATGTSAGCSPPSASPEPLHQERHQRLTDRQLLLQAAHRPYKGLPSLPPRRSASAALLLALVSTSHCLHLWSYLPNLLGLLLLPSRPFKGLKHSLPALRGIASQWEPNIC